jgi:hypothetical protein
MAKTSRNSTSSLRKQLMEVTTVSKVLAAVIFILMPFVGLFFGMMLESQNPGFFHFLLGV